MIPPRPPAYYVVACDAVVRGRYRHYMRSDGAYVRTLDTAERFSTHAEASAAARFATHGSYVVPVNPWLSTTQGASRQQF